MATSIPIAVRSGKGINLRFGPPKYDIVEDYPPVESQSCRTMTYSHDGQYLAYVNANVLKIVRTDTWKDVAVIEGLKAYHIAFSPKGTFLMTWEPFTVSKDNPEGSPNLHIYKSDSGDLVKTFVHKKQGNWEPQWSNDEKLFTRIVNTDVLFYEDLNFERIVNRINCYKVLSYSMSPNNGTYFVICHTPGTPGQPSFGRLFKYPNFEAQQPIANKSFFQAEKLNVFWNNKGNNALLLTSTEVDKTGGSYYGKQGLHFMSLSGQTAMVTMSKEGPIYSVEWSPKNTEFCVVYGYMPARATLYNTKCEPVFEFGAGPRNSVYYNPQGNLMLLGGFGNLPGHVEMWDPVAKKQIGTCEASDTTYLQWAPNGIHFLTATTSPRLRIGNGYKIWHYSGALLYETAWNELYEVLWKPYPKHTFEDPVISNQKVEGITPTQPQASKQAYRPPSARNRPTVNFKLHEDDATAHKPGSDLNPSKNALKYKKKREAKKTKKLEEGDDAKETTTSVVVSNVKIALTGDPEKDKKLKNIKKKLDAIEKLKEQQAQGKSLEINQLAKINAEVELLAELKELTLTSC